ncbi:uncharacterized protein LOC113274511 [Papaver somniferum]|uniref:uncharacterized protein LOC113274511 n=1 Tax=Papaver somniferum TaxID=3469 RepID=UPI000E6FBBD9|nr:uncharacterized protein LOC113274511 [Papaver somniferum]
MGRRYTDYRHDLHLQYRKSKSLAKAQAEFPNLSQEDWNYLCTQLFNTPEFQKLSAQNAQSRACLQFLHRGGSRSFISRGPKPVYSVVYFCVLYQLNLEVFMHVVV